MNNKIYKKEKCICVSVESGITSRCISLMDAYYLAKKYDISNLIVIWLMERWCNIKFWDVFDKGLFQDINLTVVEYSPFGVEFGEGIKAYVQKGEYRNAIYCMGQWVYYFAKRIQNREAEKMIKYFQKNDTYVRYHPSNEIGWSGEKYQQWLRGRWERVQGYLRTKVNFCAVIYCGLIKEPMERKCADAYVDTIIFKDWYYKAAMDIVSIGGVDWRTCKENRPSCQYQGEYVRYFY